MITTAGGCCDCGDRSAWKETGFCRRHRGPVSDPSSLLPPHIRFTASVSMRSAMKYIVSLIKRRENGRIQIFFEKLLQLCKQAGEGMSAIVALELCPTLETELPASTESRLAPPTTTVAPPAEESDVCAYVSKLSSMAETALSMAPHTATVSPISAVLLSAGEMSIPTRAAMHALLFHLLGDQHFKNEFARALILNYPALLLKSIQKPKYDNEDILSFSVQVFSVKSLTSDLVLSTRLLEVLSGSALQCFSTAVTQIPKEKRVESSLLPAFQFSLSSNLVARKHYWRIFHDLRYVLQSVECSKMLLFENAIALNAFIGMLSVMEAMNPQLRALVYHVNYQNTNWNSTFNMECDFMPTMGLLVQGFQRGTRQDLASMCLSQFGRQLNDWLSFLPVCPLFGGYEMVKFDPLCDYLSLHIPLHRIFTRLTREAISCFNFSIEDLHTLLPQEFLLRYIKHPLQIQASLSQIAANMWVRNGGSLSQQAELYHSSTYLSDYCYDTDIFALQLCAVLLEPTHFLAICLHHFWICSEPLWQTKLTPESSALSVAYSVVKKATAETNVEPGPARAVVVSGLRGENLQHGLPDPKSFTELLAGFLSLCVIIATDRTLAGNSTVETLLHTQIVNFLVVENLTHSKLLRLLPQPLAKHPSLDSVLKTVATFIEPSGMEPGRYQLKPEYWEEFNPYFTHFVRSDLSKAEERYNTHMKSRSSSSASSSHPFTPCPKLQPPFAPLRNITRILHSHLLHAVLLAVLYNHARNATTTERLLTVTLHLLTLAAKTHTEFSTELHSQTPQPLQQQCVLSIQLPHESNLVINVRAEVIPPNSTSPVSILSLLCDLAKSTSHAVHLPQIILVLRELCSLDTEIQSIVTSSVGDLISTPEEQQVAANKRRRLQNSQKRQAAIMAQFAAQQEAFAHKFADEGMFGDVKKEEVTTSNTNTTREYVCVMCRETVTDASSLNSKPMGLIAQVQLSSVLQKVKLQSLVLQGTAFDQWDALSDVTVSNEQTEVTSPPHPSTSTAPPATTPGAGTEQAARQTAPTSTTTNSSAETEPNSSGTTTSTITAENAVGNTARELLRDIGSTPGVFVSCCSHAIHAECFQTYFESLRKRDAAGSDYEGRSAICLSRGEFCCPACRQLANCIIPIIVEPSVNQPEVVQGDSSSSTLPSGASPTSSGGRVNTLKTWVSGLFGFFQSKQAAEPLPASPLNIFAHRIYQAITKQRDLPSRGTLTFPTYVSGAIASTIATLEVELRAKPTAEVKLYPQQQEQLRYMCRAAHALYAEDSALCQLYKDLLLGTLTGEFEKHSVPLELEVSPLDCDPFACVVHLVCMEGSNVLESILPSAFFAWLVKSTLALKLPRTTSETAATTSTSTQSEEQRESLDSVWELGYQVAKLWLPKYSDKEATVDEVTPSSLVEQLATHSLCFLRRVALFMHACFEWENPPTDFEALLTYLKLTGMKPSLSNTSSVQETTTKQKQLTFKTLQVWLQKTIRSGTQHPLVDSPLKPFSLISLPNEYVNLFRMSIDHPCSLCGSVPAEPAVCLICGDMLCWGSPMPGPGGKEMGQCNLHSCMCMGGVGVLLLVKQVSVVLLAPHRLHARGTVWWSIYLDSHREEDIGMRRGRPLFLDAARYAQLNTLVVTNNIENYCVQHFRPGINWLHF
ncbi:E3 ubiquitin-protein ligase UBR3 [Pelomyxa schiedti]|nr:E3 ubiquitin-protein ligase UBR3 [Pelomyxa schiedti]